MPVGFGYIRDEQPAIVDWSAITREARETIKGIEADRQAKREGVDQAIRRSWIHIYRRKRLKCNA